MSVATLREEAGAAPRPQGPPVGLLGMGGDEHLAGSLLRAARMLGVPAVLFDAAEAWRGPRLLRAFNWRFRDRRPPAGRTHLARLGEAIERSGAEILIATGLVPLDRPVLRALRARGITTVNYSTDDPWNPAMASRWFQRSLPEYDIVFTPRRSNIDDFKQAGCADVRYLPFGYDARLLAAPDTGAPSCDVLFVGGADDDRAAFMRCFVQRGLSVTLVGGYWQRYRDLRACAFGLKTWDQVAALTRAAKVNLCLVRRANRDGHVMRSFEIAACGGCLLAEDTDDHRAFFGPAGEAVCYFSSPEEAARQARALIADPAARQALARRLRQRIGDGGHSYSDRMAAILNAAQALRRGARAAAEGAAC